MLKSLRIFGNIGVIFGQYLLLFVSKEAGLCVILFCSIINLPYFVKHRDYDVILLILISSVINLVGLIGR